VIRFPTCRFPDVIDRKHFHFRLTLVRQLFARVRNFVEATRFLSSSFTEVPFCKNFQGNIFELSQSRCFVTVIYFPRLIASLNSTVNVKYANKAFLLRFMTILS